MSLTDTGSLRRARTPVTAVVVTRGRSPFLPRALVALAEQTRRPERVVLVDAGEQEDPAIREMAIRCGIPDASLVNVQARWSRSFGRAVAAGLREAELAEDELVFLLHDDSYPRYDCLEKLARAVEFAPSVVIAGPKQLRADRPEALGQVGVTTSRFGRRMTGAEDGELDQGQYDHREDMLGVGAAGMLVRADAWRELGGIDPSLGPFRDGLNLSRRARLAGYRVIVVPQAVVYHEQASFRGLRGKADAPDVRRSFLARRRAFVYSELVQVHPLLVPLALAAAVVSGIARAAWRMASKDLDLAPAELIAPFEVLARPERIWAGRRLARGSARLSRRTIHPLQTTSREVRAMHRDRRLARAEEVRVREAPSEVELAERAALAKRRRRVLGVVAGFALLVSVIALGGLAGGGRIAGGALAQLTVSAGQAWDRAFGSWIDQGLGHAGPADPMAAVLALAQTLGLGHGTALLMLACPLGAALGAWFAAGAAARSVAVRAWVALVWFAAPPLWLALASGRLGAAVTHAALPWALLALARAAGVDRRDVIRREVPHSGEADDAGSPAPAAGPPSVTAAAAAGLALALAAAGTPGLLPLVLLGLLLVGVTTRVRWRLAFAALPPLALFAPLIAHAVRTGSWRALLADPGLPLASAPAPVWRALLGWPADPVVPEGFGVGVGALMFFSAFTVVAALAALARRGPRSRAVRVGWAVALAGLFGAAAAARIDVGESAEAFIRPWAGGAVSLVLAGLLLAAAAGADGAGSWFDVVGGSHRIEAGVLAGVMLLAPCAGLADAVWQWRSGSGIEVRRESVPELPAIAALSAASPDSTSTLVLGVDGDAVSWRVVRGDGLQQLDPAAVVLAERLTGPLAGASPAAGDRATDALSYLVARAATGYSEGIGAELAGAGIGFILAPAAESELAAALDATAGLSRAAETGSGTLWRVGSAEDAARPTWARVVEPDGSESALPAGQGVPPGGQGRELVLAERADPGWRATLDGQELAAAAGTDWRQRFTLPAAGGTPVIEHKGLSLGAVQAVVFAITALTALPLRRRRGQGES